MFFCTRHLVVKRARRPVGDESDGAAASNRAAESDGNSTDHRARRMKNTVPGDLELRGSHGYIPAGPNKVWADLVIATGTSPSHAVEAARIEGGAAQRAADAKHTKHDHTIPSNVHFVAAAFEADGFTSPLVLNLLRGFSKKRTDRDDADDCAKSAWFSFFAEALANTHVRHLARTILARAEAIDEHLGDTRRDRLTATDAEATRARIRRSGPPDPPGSSKKRCRQ